LLVRLDQWKEGGGGGIPLRLDVHVPHLSIYHFIGILSAAKFQDMNNNLTYLIKLMFLENIYFKHITFNTS